MTSELILCSPGVIDCRLASLFFGIADQQLFMCGLFLLSEHLTQKFQTLQKCIKGTPNCNFWRGDNFDPKSSTRQKFRVGTAEITFWGHSKFLGFWFSNWLKRKKAVCRKMLIGDLSNKCCRFGEKAHQEYSVIQWVPGFILPHHLSLAQNQFTFDDKFFFKNLQIWRVPSKQSARFLPQYCAFAKLRIFCLQNDAVFGEVRGDTDKMRNCPSQLRNYAVGSENQIGISFCRDRWGVHLMLLCYCWWRMLELAWESGYKRFLFFPNCWIDSAFWSCSGRRRQWIPPFPCVSFKPTTPCAKLVWKRACCWMDFWIWQFSR